MAARTKPEGFRNYRTTGELASYLGVTRKTVRMWMAEGKIKASVVIGTWHLFSPEYANKLMQDRVKERM